MRRITLLDVFTDDFVTFRRSMAFKSIHFKSRLDLARILFFFYVTFYDLADLVKHFLGGVHRPESVNSNSTN